MDVTSERLVVCASHSPGKERDVEHAFGRRFRSALTSAAERAQQFDPDVVIVFGGDHRRAFRHVVPAFGVALSASILAEGGHPTGDLDVPSVLARELCEHLLSTGFDVAACRDIGLDHAFAQPVRDLLGELAAKPVIPVPVNCATGPLPTGRRVAEFGAEVGGSAHQDSSRLGRRSVRRHVELGCRGADSARRHRPRPCGRGRQ
jgi:2,3-dihydroxyphenylpropionate 1,2-dioxygenase